MLLETIRCADGVVQNIAYHQERLDRSLHVLNIKKQYDLKSLIIPPSIGVYRCRFLYDDSKCAIEFHPYTPKKIASLKLIHADNIEYSLKYANRDALNILFEQRGTCDDILIVRKGFLTDTTIANIALFINEQWLTPDYPLLMGTTRARLINNGLIIPYPLSLKDISKATKIALMNSMVGFIEVENGIIA